MVRVRPSAAMEAAGQAAEASAQLVLVQVQAAAQAAAVSGGGMGGGGGKEPAGLPCPRCESTDTKFCYYNNYNLGQPRHFCKGCRRYWTRGGALRNVPVGGGTRKPTPAAARRKRPSSSSSSSTSAAFPSPPPPLLASPAPLSMSAPPYAMARPAAYDLASSFMPSLSSPLAAVDPDRRLLDLGGSFSSLLAPAPAPDVRFSAGFRVGGGLAPHMMPPASSAPAHAHAHAHALLPPPLPPMSQALPEGLIWSMGWPDLSI